VLAQYLISASILSADFSRLGEQIHEAEDAGRLIHADDGWACTQPDHGSIIVGLQENHAIAFGRALDG
jgi:hypothetical protein